MNGMLFRGLWIALLLLGGCSTVNMPAPPSATPAPAAVTAPAPSAGQGRLKPMPLRTFTVATECSFRDETGNLGSASVDVLNSKVRALKVVLTMPRHGICRFDLAQFRQTQALPSIELTGARSCRIHMWEQDEQVTVAFTDCAQSCSPASAHDYVWPLLIDKPTGHCD